MSVQEKGAGSPRKEVDWTTEEYYCMDHRVWTKREGHKGCTFFPMLHRVEGRPSLRLQEQVMKTPSANVMFNIMEVLQNGKKTLRGVTRLTDLNKKTVKDGISELRSKRYVTVRFEEYHRGVVEKAWTVELTEAGRNAYFDLKPVFDVMLRPRTAPDGTVTIG